MFDNNSLLTESYANIAANTSSVYTLCSTASAGVQNTSASLRYETRGEKYFIIAETDPDFGGFTEDMVGGTIFFPEPTNPFPKSFAGPYANPIYNQLEDGDGQGELDTGSQEFTPSVNISGGTGFTAGSSGGGGSSGY